MYCLGGWRAGSVFKSTILADNLGSDISNHMEATNRQQSITPLPGNLSPLWLLHTHMVHMPILTQASTQTHIVTKYLIKQNFYLHMWRGTCMCVQVPLKLEL